ncbi:MAG TPA: ABC transporter permease subunit, partial [Clostridiales bacterium]|nr:ABC transporter permease subunit [Clostridiales bacterium]
MKSGKAQSAVLKTLVCSSAAATVAVLVFIVVYILFKGLPHLSPKLFSLHYSSDNVSMLPAMVNTVSIVLLSLLIAAPVGIFSAIFLVEYAGRGNRFVSVIRTTAETLAGIPSIVYGLFGYLLFVVALGWGYSLIAGAATLAIMILPVIMRTTEEALKAVPDIYREG